MSKQNQKFRIDTKEDFDKPFNKRTKQQTFKEAIGR